MRNFYLGLISLLGILCIPQKMVADIVLNEMMPCNVSTLLNEYQNYTGWVELYNSGTTTVNIKGYTFENKYTSKSGIIKIKEWIITSDIKIAAGEYKILYFDEEEGSEHAPWKIETDGGFLSLYDAGHSLIDSFEYSTMFAHVSWGKATNLDEWDNYQGYMVKPTPGVVNVRGITSQQRVQKPQFSVTPGFCSSSFTLSLSSESGATIYYTTDGSEPIESSKLYSTAITVSKSTVIRARAYSSKKIYSDIATGTYIFADSYHNACGGYQVPFVAISTAPDNFFGNEMGIYVKGTNGIVGKKSCDTQKANYNQDWKRPINFEYIVDNKQVVSQELDAAVMGGCSRQYSLKSLKLTASNKLGSNKIIYDFFPDKTGNEYKSLQLRNGGNDYDYSRIRDGFMQSLVQGRMNVDYQSYRPVAFFINGEYYGQMDLRERTNKDYVFSNYGLDEEDIELLEVSEDMVIPSLGTLDAYNSLIEKAQTDATSSDYYEKMNRLMDLDEYVDYQIFEQFIVNTDWPANNTKIWREKETGRFRWIIYDTDFGFGLYGASSPNFCDPALNMIDFCMGEGSVFNWANATQKSSYSYVYDDASKWKTILFRSLMQNQTFKEKFLNKFILHLGTTFTIERVNSVLDSVYTNAESEICAHWKKNNEYYNPYADQKEEMSGFANKRTTNVWSHLQDYFNLGNIVSLSISSNISNADFIINGERLNASEYNGKYFENKVLNVKPIAPAGYKFTSWKLSSSTSTSILDFNSVWKYYYKGDQPAGSWMAESYSDTSWDEGYGKFGYASSNSSYTTVLDYGSDADNKYLTSYFRNTFEISDLSAFDAVKGSLVYDDGVVIYVNGQEISRLNMEEGDVTYETVAITYVNDAVASFTIDKSYLKKGTNVIAVELHQNVATSSDMTFELSLVGTVNKDGNSTSEFNGALTDDMVMIANFEKSTYTKPSLFINELCLSNDSLSEFSNEYGVYADWIEIYNAGNESVDLAGMYLTDDALKLTKSQFPTNSPFETTVLPGEHKIIWADNAIWQGALHADFKLSATTISTVVLSQMVNGTLEQIDAVTYELHATNDSYGRISDGASEWRIFTLCLKDGDPKPTPGEENGSSLCDSGVSNQKIFSDNSLALKLYPNPAKTHLNVIVENADTYSILIYDNMGRLIESLVHENSKTPENISVQSYTSGIYCVKVVTSDAVLQQKFIKY